MKLRAILADLPQAARPGVGQIRDLERGGRGTMGEEWSQQAGKAEPERGRGTPGVSFHYGILT